MKTFNFTKKPKDLTKGPECMATIIKCGTCKFTMTEYKDIYGHDDSLPYSAMLCLNGTPLCTCFNDGWGGDTALTPINVAERERFKTAMEEVRQYKWKYENYTMQLDIDFIADILATTEHNTKLKNRK